MAPFLRLGPLLLQLPLLAVLVGVWLGLLRAEKEGSRLELPPTVLGNLVYVGLIAGIAGARLAYAARYLEAYQENPWGLLSLNTNTLQSFDGFLIGLAAATLYARKKKLLLCPTLDALAPGLALFAVALGVAHLLSGDAFGASARLPWSIYLWGELRHPSQGYEILAALAVYFLVSRRPLGRAGSGTNFLFFVALSSAARIFLEAFRGDSVTWSGGFRVAQFIGMASLAAALYLLPIWGRENEGGEKLDASSKARLNQDTGIAH